VDRLEPSLCREFARRALAEDIGSGDITSLALLSSGENARAIIVAREALTVAGLDLAMATFREIDDAIECERTSEEGQSLAAASPILCLSGSARALLSGERTALNFLQRLSGIATLTAKYHAAIEGTGARLLDTRKTTPGWRVFEKHAVACGGGTNHRMGLYDMVLIKDNHLAALRSEANPIATAIARAKEACPGFKIEAEADTLEQAAQAAEAGADIILLDNMPPVKLSEAVQLVAGRSKLEASGGITMANIRAVAETGVDFISVGALTHSPQAVDIAMDFDA
jgi:nicotinate-nucleotide pyrophosphorylase (carboxylating)